MCFFNNIKLLKKMELKMDIFKKCYDFTKADEAKKSGLYPYFTEIEKVEGNYVWVDGRKILMVGSNNYLGLFDDQIIKDYKTSYEQRNSLSG